MKAPIVTMAFFLAGAMAPLHAAGNAPANAYAQCGTYDSYLLIYRTTSNFEEAGKLRCGEKVEMLNHLDTGYTQVRTQDGKVGWVRDFDLSPEPPPPHQTFSFGMTEPERKAAANSAANLAANPAHAKALEGVLTNDDVLKMLGRRVEPNAIEDKIRNTRCDFDTSPATVLRLKEMGVQDKIILAMLEAPVVNETSGPVAAQSVKVKIKDGTPIAVELAGNLWPDGMQEGAVVEMTAAEDLVVNGVAVIVHGSPARARVMGMKLADPSGESGQVAWFMQDIVSVSGERVPVTFALKQLPGTYRAKNFDGYPYLTSDFRKGDPAIKASGKHFLATVHGDTVLRIPTSQAASPAEFQPALKPVPAVAAQAPVQVAGPVMTQAQATLAPNAITAEAAIPAEPVGAAQVSAQASTQAPSQANAKP
ncbi:MAG: hypothetical protein WBS18_09575 [Candidatus Acidiferrales bacterium]